MENINPFKGLSPTTLADVLSRDRVMDFGIRPLWEPMPRITGPAFTVRCGPGDNLMLHVAIYRASPDSVIVVESADVNYAVAGGNVCAVAQKLGIAGFVIDGVIRDLAEIRQNKFPVFARGIIPKPGGKEFIDTLNNAPVRCGGVQVTPGDIVVADEEGIVVVPTTKVEEILKSALMRSAPCPDKDASQTLSDWQEAHRARTEEILRKKSIK